MRLGLSNKEVAQIFNSLSANSFRVAGTKRLVAIRCLKLLAELLQALPIWPNPVQNGQAGSFTLSLERLHERMKDGKVAAKVSIMFNPFWAGLCGSL